MVRCEVGRGDEVIGVLVASECCFHYHRRDRRDEGRGQSARFESRSCIESPRVTSAVLAPPACLSLHRDAGPRPSCVCLCAWSLILPLLLLLRLRLLLRLLLRSARPRPSPLPSPPCTSPAQSSHRVKAQRDRQASQQSSIPHSRCPRSWNRGRGRGFADGGRVPGIPSSPYTLPACSYM